MGVWRAGTGYVSCDTAFSTDAPPWPRDVDGRGMIMVKLGSPSEVIEVLLKLSRIRSRELSIASRELSITAVTLSVSSELCIGIDKKRTLGEEYARAECDECAGEGSILCVSTSALARDDNW